MFRDALKHPGDSKLIVKDRYKLQIAGHLAHIYVYKGELLGLVTVSFRELSAKEYADLRDEAPADCLAVDGQGFLLDGFPRTVYQAEKLDEFLASHGGRIDHVIDIAVDKDELMSRLTGRRVCKACGASYHVVNIPPKKEGVCDVCGGELIQRADDNAETVANRIEVYEAQTMPLIAYYEKAGNISHIDGATGLDSVFADIVQALGE